MEDRERKPFVITNCHKRNFRYWVQDQFPEIKKYSFSDSPPYTALEERFDEVHAAAGQVFDIIFSRSDYDLQRYYSQDRTALGQAHQRKDIGAYARALDAFLGAIKEE